MSISVRRNLLWWIIDFSSTEELLSVWILIKNNSKACCHVNNLSACVVKYVLTRILATITIDILKLIGFIRWGFVYWRMICGLLYSTNPRLNSHEFFLFYLRLDNCKDINIWVLNKFTRLSGFFVSSNTNWNILLSEFWGLSPGFCTLRFFRLTGTHVIETFKNNYKKTKIDAYKANLYI